MFDNFWVIFGSLIIGIVLIICAVSAISERVSAPLLAQIDSMGYKSSEVRIFCRRIDASLEDFISSDGLKKQYEIFSSGGTSDFIKTAESNKKSKEARAQGQAVGMSTGLAIGMSSGQ